MSIPRIKYPDAEWLGRNAEGWGPLPDRGGTMSQIRYVLHTTEGTSLPPYTGGSHPHVTFDPARGIVYQDVHFDRRAGTLIGSSTTGVLGNEISLQAEIIAFSDRGLANSHGGLWVGDFTDAHYQQIADWIDWCTIKLGVPCEAVYGPAVDFDCFLYGKHAATRMDSSTWLQFGHALTGHGAATGNSHWDTGELDLHRLFGMIGDVDVTNIGIDFCRQGDKNNAVRFWQRVLRHLEAYDGAIDGYYGPEMVAAVAEIMNQDGTNIGNSQAFKILAHWIDR